MSLDKKSIFLKAWVAGLFAGGILAIAFWIISDIFSLLKGSNDVVTFIDTLIAISIVGNALGAGTVMWRVVDKYRLGSLKPMLRRYVLFSLLSLAAAVGLLYSPVPFFVSLWSLVAPLLVLYVLSKQSKLKTK